MTDERITAVGALRAKLPPWLQRTHGARVMFGIADVLDDYADRLVQGVKVRFPGVPPRPIDEAALALTGRERRLRRGPGEAASTYARRLPGWWDAHRRSGSPYVLLEQLYAFFVDYLATVQIDVVAHSGLRHSLDDAGTITRDSITWSVPPDGTDEWAHIWVMFHVGTEPLAVATLVTSSGDVIVTSDGNSLIAVTSLSAGGVLAEEAAETFRAIPREWSAAHIPYVTVVLLYGLGRLWDYPTPVPTYTAREATGATWDSDTPVILIAE